MRKGTVVVCKRMVVVRKSTVVVRKGTGVVRKGTMVVRKGTAVVVRKGTGVVRKGTAVVVRKGVVVRKIRSDPSFFGSPGLGSGILKTGSADPDPKKWTGSATVVIINKLV